MKLILNGLTNHIDYQNSDIWLSFIEFLNTVNLMKGDTILTIVISRNYNVSFALMQFNEN